MRIIDTRKIVPLAYQKKCVKIIKKASVSRERVPLAIAMGFGKTARAPDIQDIFTGKIMFRSRPEHHF